MTLEDVIVHWAHRWRNLSAWGRNLPSTVKLSPHNGQRILGRAHCITGLIEVYITGSLAEDLSTVLHELAHVAAPLYNDHRDPWRKLYTSAVAEACRCDVDQFDINVAVADLDDQCREAITGWLKRSGQLTVLRAIGVMA